MDIEYKKIAARFAREGKTKLELVMAVPKATSEELKEINNFFNASKEILELEKKGVGVKKLVLVLKNVGYTKDDLDLIEGKKDLNNILINVASNLVGLVFILVLVFVFGGMFLNIIMQTDWDFLKSDYVVSGLLFGDDTNFSDLRISSNAVLKGFSVSGSEYSATIRCSKKLTLSFSKVGFVPVHKNIDCGDQDLDVVFANMNGFVKLDLDKVTNVVDKGVKLDLNGGDLVVLGTNVPAINPSVSVTAFNPNTPGDMQFFPGELEGLQSDGNVTGLESYGFAKIIAEDENGNSLDFKEGTSAKLTFAIDEKQREGAPSEIPLWYFDEIKGTWVEEGIATKTCVGNSCQYVGEMNRVRSSWNADHPVPFFERVLDDWFADDENNDESDCPTDKPQKIFGTGKQAQGKESEEYICCPSETKQNEVVFVEGSPKQCSCPKTTPNKISVNIGVNKNADVCCPPGNNAARYDKKWFGLVVTETCGSCNYGRLMGEGAQKQICKGICYVCKGEKIVELGRSLSGSSDCEEKVVQDCSSEGKVCVDHVIDEYADPHAQCEYCPSSVNFVTGDDSLFLDFYDGYNYGFGNASSNTFLGLNSIESVFGKITQICKTCSGKGRFLNVIVNDHANVGLQSFGSNTLTVEGFSRLGNNAYDFSCVKKVLFAGCSIAGDYWGLRGGVEGRNFLQASANYFGAPTCGANHIVLAPGRSDILPGWRVTVNPNSQNVDLHTIFYSTADNLFFPGMPNEAYQTKILSGELGQVRVSIDSLDSFRNKIGYLSDNNMFCPYSVIDSMKFDITSTTSLIKFGNFKIEIPSGSVPVGRVVKLQINKLDVNCTDFENGYWTKSSNIDSVYLQNIKEVADLKLISQENYDKTKTLFDNNWVCLDDNDCFGPCPMGDLDCSYSCTQNHECKINSNISNLIYIPSTSSNNSNTIIDLNSSSKLLSSNNKYAFMTLSQQSVGKRNVKFEDIGKEISFTYSGYVAPQIAFAINNVPSTPQNLGSVPSSGAVFSGYSLNNCSLWNGYPTELADCISGYDSLFKLNSSEALSYASTIGLSNKDTGIVYTKLADYYSDINFCYNIFGKDYYSGISCIKLVDKEKTIDSNQNVSNIVNKNMVDYSLSFSLRNLAEYYMDRNYCLPIPTESQRLACLAKFPEPVVIPVVVVPLCGNGKIDGAEKCDGGNFIGKSCASFGFNAGSLACVNCQVNKSGCYNVHEGPVDPEPNVPDEPNEPIQVCGNNLVEGNEDCDGSDLDGATCVDYGFASGVLSCVDCRVVTSSCVSAPVVPTQVCGNNVIEGTEQCEGTNFNGKTCSTYGFNSGALSCSGCQIVNRACVNVVAPPVEIDPLEVFDCPYSDSYSSPIKDVVNSSFWIKEIRDGKVFGLRVPFKKVDCVGETVLVEDDSGNVIPCVTQLNDVDGCILEKRELLTITSASDNYVVGGKYNSVYKQNPVDFVGGDGNVFFLIKSGGKHEYVKFNSVNLEINETLQVYDENDYLLRSVPSVLRSVPSGDIFWVVLNGALHDVYVASDPSCGNVAGCFNNPNTTTSYGGTGDAEMGTTSYVTAYGWGKVFIAKSISSGEAVTRVNNMVPCYESCRFTPFGGGYTGTAYLTQMSFTPSQMTYAGDGFGNLLVRSNTDINEYSIDSNDIALPSATR